MLGFGDTASPPLPELNYQVLSAGGPGFRVGLASIGFITMVHAQAMLRSFGDGLHVTPLLGANVLILGAQPAIYGVHAGARIGRAEPGVPGLAVDITTSVYGSERPIGTRIGISYLWGSRGSRFGGDRARARADWAPGCGFGSGVPAHAGPRGPGGPR